MSAQRSPAAAQVGADAPPKPAGRPRSEDCRRRILTAARELLDERGLRAMTIEAIAERAGTSKVTIYRWWSHKAGIVLDAILEDITPRAPRRVSESPLQALHDEMMLLCRFLQGHVGRSLIGVVAEGVLDPEIGEAYREHWIKPRRERARGLITRAIEAGELAPDVDVEVVIDALFGPLYYRFLVKHAPLTTAYAESVYQAVVGGVGAAKSRAQR
jgi:AcrR family transcriptional regulator